LDVPPTKETLQNVLALLELSPRELMRKGESEYAENNLADQSLSDDELIEAMLQFPKLIERPIVVKNGRAAIGRPPESVLNIL
jgi:arsenate reductase